MNSLDVPTSARPDWVCHLITSTAVKYGSIRAAAAAYGDRYGIHPASANTCFARWLAGRPIDERSLDQLEVFAAS